MGSLIGDYVHLTKQGYFNKTGRNVGPYFDGFEESFKARQDYFNAWLKLTEGEEQKSYRENLRISVEEQLGILKDASSLRSKNISNQKHITALLNDIADIMRDKYLKVDLIAAAAGYENKEVVSQGGALSEEGFRRSINKGVDGKRKPKKRTRIQKQNIQRISSRINDFLKDIYNNYKDLNGASYEDIRKGTTKLNEIFNQIIKDLSSVNKSNDELNQSKKNIQERIQLLLKRSRTKNKNVLKELLTITSSLYEGLSSKQFIGEFGEAVVEVAAKRATDLATSTAQTGMQTSIRRVNLANFIPEARDTLRSKFNEKTDVVSEDGMFVGQFKEGLQDKVDVSITYKSGFNEKISVKTYRGDSFRSFGGTSASDMLQLIQNENDEDFINHYLNLAVRRKKTNELKRIEFLLKRIMAAKLIAGYNYSTFSMNNSILKQNSMESATSFMWIDFSADKGNMVHFFSINDLLNAAEDQILAMKFPVLINKKQEKIEDRLSKLISPFAKHRISVVINKNVMNNLDEKRF